MSIAERTVSTGLNASTGLEQRRTTPGGGTAGTLTRAGRALLRLPLFYKLIIANGAITLAAVALSTVLITRAVRDNPAAGALAIILPVVAAAVAASIVANALVVRLALTPIRALELAAEQVRAGEHAARAAESAVSDASTQRVVQTFNTMLDSLATYRARLREIAIRALDAAENERLRLSKELHDNHAQSLAALLVQLRVARAAGPAAGGQIEAIAKQLSGVIEEFRALATQLRPAALDMLGLSAALTGHARSVTEASGLNLEVAIGPVDGLLSSEAELALYRLVQEALLNVVRHGETEAAHLVVRPENEGVTAIITDRGRGFNVNSTLAGGALGLIGMVERAAYLGGTVDIQSQPGAGTTIRIVIPRKDVRTHG